MPLWGLQIEANEELLCKHVHLENEAAIQVAKLAPMYMVDSGETQEADAMLAACRKWVHTCKDTQPKKRDALLKKYLGSQADMEEGATAWS